MTERPLLDHITLSAVAIEDDRSIATARSLMAEHGIRHLPVLKGGAVVGEISERDLMVYDRGAPDRAARTPVGHIMVEEPYVVAPDASLAQVAREMMRRKIGSAIVVDRGKLIGMFTTTDALRALVEPPVLD